MFETLITRDERVRSENMGHYLRAATDKRNLTANKFVVKGEANESHASHNTNYLDVQGVIKKIMMTVYLQRPASAGKERGRE